MDFRKQSIEEFTDALGSKAPVPGGGGASALVAALGAALGAMVVSLTAGKAKYEDVQDIMAHVGGQIDYLQSEFLSLIQEDAEAFEPLSKAYKLPSGTAEEAAEKRTVLENALKIAADPPLKIMRKCCEAIELLSILATKGNKLVVSDAGTGALLCKAALHGAGLSLLINTSMMKDSEYKESLERERALMIEEYSGRADAVYERSIAVITDY